MNPSTRRASRRSALPHPDGRLSGCFEICVFCGHTHSAAERLRVVRRMLPCTAEDVLDGWSCLFDGPEGREQLQGALRELGAVCDADGEWCLP